MRGQRYKIAVSGAARIEHCCAGIKELSKEVGREIVRQNCVLITGATTGVPYFAALGCKEIRGFSVGFSPATSELVHLKTYKLPLDAFDIMIYTGADYVGRNIMMTKAADGVIIICGRMGTLHEFATAFEIQKPIGVLEGSGGTADKIKKIATGPYRGVKKIVYGKDPKRLVKKLIELIQQDKKFRTQYELPRPRRGGVSPSGQVLSAAFAAEKELPRPRRGGVSPSGQVLSSRSAGRKQRSK